MISFEWHDVRTPVFISLWLFFTILIKIGFHHSERLVVIFPDSALLIVGGLVVGWIVDHFWAVDIYLHPDLFFLYLLPPIAFDAGYFLPNKAFFQNLWTITTYAVVGTIWNIVSIGFLLYMFSPYYTMQIPFLDIMLFATLISAVDPVAVLSVFEEINVNKLLYICVFGESLLNDAVTIVLYHALSSMAKIGPEYLEKEDFLKASFSFFLVAFGGIIIGVCGAAITGLTTKFSHSLNNVQPLICLLLPYLAYLIAEMVHLSGILSIVVCGLLMKPYVSSNISSESSTTVSYFAKTLSSTCEAIIFVFLGLSTVSKYHKWDIVFTAVTVIACFACRFVGTYMLTYLCNNRRVEKIGLVDQFIMAYGGLRGAICYGLVMTLDSSAVPAKDMFVSTTIVVILFTVFVQGATIKPLVRFLHVKTQEHHLKNVTEHVIANARDDMMAGLEAIAGVHGHYWWRRRMSEFNRDFIEPVMAHAPQSRGQRLMLKYDEVNAIESKRRLMSECEAPGGSKA
ncbi:hypothetical protein QR680_016978 [Steinernema hermaphroditum]|uniref:Sodium/hydrogen exchanger n=1 Tax=Steinernema hermaphroditum TaxID=289476 RepID=A0AA39LNB2_9BILA|nr:hypothetical protein QR680_016978 [Steinernema hermaphroditum]